MQQLKLLQIFYEYICLKTAMIPNDITILPNRIWNLNTSHRLLTSMCRDVRSESIFFKDRIVTTKNILARSNYLFDWILENTIFSFKNICRRIKKSFTNLLSVCSQTTCVINCGEWVISKCIDNNTFDCTRVWHFQYFLKVPISRLLLVKNSQSK